MDFLETQQSPFSNKLLSTFLCCLLIFLFYLLRYDTYAEPYYFDDQIPLDVIEYMSDNNTLDTNWGNVANQWFLPEYKNQYNFSSYISSLFYLESVFSIAKDERLIFYRQSSIIFQILAAFALIYLGFLLHNQFTGWAAAYSLAVIPMFVIDAHYARPESFIILVSTLFLLSSFKFYIDKHLRWFFLAGFFWGIMLGSKLSLLPMAAIPFFTLYLITKDEAKASWFFKHTLFFIIFVLLGLFFLAPYMLINISGVFEGFQFLWQQYLKSNNQSSEIQFFLIPFLFVFIGPLFWFLIFYNFSRFTKPFNEQQVFLIICLLVVLAYIGFFSLMPFFNEANLSHLAPIICLLSATGLQQLISSINTSHFNRGLSICICISIFALPLVLSHKINSLIYNKKHSWYADKNSRIEALMQEHNADAFIPSENFFSQLQHIANKSLGHNSLIEVPWLPIKDYIDFHKKLEEWGYEQLAVVKSPLSFLPHSQLETLHLAPEYHYYILK